MSLVSAAKYCVRHVKKLNNQNLSTFKSTPTKILSDADQKKFWEAFPRVFDTLCKEYALIPYYKEYFEKMFYYNVPTGKLVKGQYFLVAYKSLKWSEQNSPEDEHLAHVIAWCWEMQQSMTLMFDDVQDHSEFRRGRLSWYRMPNIGLSALTDAGLIEESIFLLLKKYFYGKDVYANLVNSFHDSLRHALIGQHMDAEFSCKAEHKFKYFNMKNYKILARQKCIGFLYHGCIQSVLHFTKRYDKKMMKQVYDFVDTLGEAYQIENDIQDILVAKNSEKKTQNDIKEGKCTWLASYVIENGSEKQKRVLYENLGKSDPRCESAVIDLYRELHIMDAFLSYKLETIAKLNEILLSTEFECLHAFLEKSVQFLSSGHYSISSIR